MALVILRTPPPTFECRADVAQHMKIYNAYAFAWVYMICVFFSYISLGWYWFCSKVKFVFNNVTNLKTYQHITRRSLCYEIIWLKILN